MGDTQKALVSTVVHLFINDIADRALADTDRDKSSVDKYITQCNSALSYYRGSGVTKIIASADDYYRKKCESRDSIVTALANYAVLSNMRDSLTHERKQNIVEIFIRDMVAAMHGLAIENAKIIMHPRNRNSPEYIEKIRHELEVVFDLTKQNLQQRIMTGGKNDEVERVKKALVEAIRAQTRAEADLKSARKRISELERALDKSTQLIDTLKSKADDTVSVSGSTTRSLAQSDRVSINQGFKPVNPPEIDYTDSFMPVADDDYDAIDIDKQQPAEVSKFINTLDNIKDAMGMWT